MLPMSLVLSFCAPGNVMHLSTHIPLTLFLRLSFIHSSSNAALVYIASNLLHRDQRDGQTDRNDVYDPRPLPFKAELPVFA